MSLLREIFEAMATRLSDQGFAFDFGRGSFGQSPSELGANPFICLDYDRTKPASFGPSKTSHKRNPRVHYEVSDPCVAFICARSTRDGASEDDHTDELHYMEAGLVSTLYEVAQSKGIGVEGLTRQVEGDDTAEYRSLFARVQFNLIASVGWEPRVSSNGDSLVMVTTSAANGLRVDAVCAPEV